jgi:YHS domain-containing protein
MFMNSFAERQVVDLRMARLDPKRYTKGMKKFVQILLIAGLAATVVPAAPQDKKADQKAASKEVTDVVCGMTVDPKDSDKSDYKGKTYYFCSAADKKEFEKNPDKYIKEANKK